MQFQSSDWLSHHGIWAIIPCPPNMVTVLVCSKLKTSSKSVFFTNKVNIVDPTMLGVAASVLAVLCKWMHQVPTILGPAVNLGKDTTYTTLETMCNARVAPTMLEGLEGSAVQADPTLLRYASPITGQKSLPQKFDCFQALRKRLPECKKTQQCCVHLHGAKGNVTWYSHRQ